MLKIPSVTLLAAEDYFDKKKRRVLWDSQGFDGKPSFRTIKQRRASGDKTLIPIQTFADLIILPKIHLYTSLSLS